MNARHDFVRLFASAADDRNTMLVACTGESSIAPPSVGVNRRTRLDDFPNEVQQALGRSILDAFQSDTPMA